MRRMTPKRARKQYHYLLRVLGLLRLSSRRVSLALYSHLCKGDSSRRHSAHVQGSTTVYMSET